MTFAAAAAGVNSPLNSSPFGFWHRSCGFYQRNCGIGQTDLKRHCYWGRKKDAVLNNKVNKLSCFNIPQHLPEGLGLLKCWDPLEDCLVSPAEEDCPGSSTEEDCSRSLLLGFFSFSPLGSLPWSGNLQKWTKLVLSNCLEARCYADIFSYIVQVYIS